MKKLSLLFLLLTFSLIAFSQEEDSTSNSSLDLGLDLMSRYYWRGLNLSSSPVFQPTMAYTYKGFTVGSWASFTFAKEDFQEVDIFLSYNKKFFTLTFNDYFYFRDSLNYTNNYFDWDKTTTSHLLEGIVEFSNIPDIPFSLLAGVILYGADINSDGNNNFSSYIELGYNFSIKNIDTKLFAGFTPFDGLYASGFNFINIGFSAVKEIKVTDKFSFPISTTFSINPAIEKVYFVVGVSF